MGTSKEDLKFALEHLSSVLESISKKLDRNIVSQIVLSFLAYLYLREPRVVESVLRSLKLMDIPPELFQIAAPAILIYLFTSWSYGSFQYIRVRKNLEEAYKEYFDVLWASNTIKDSLDKEMFVPHSGFKYLYQANLSSDKVDHWVLHLALLPLTLVVSANTSISVFYAAHYLPNVYPINLVVAAAMIATYAIFYLQFYRKMKDFVWYQEWVVALAFINVFAGGNLILYLAERS